MPVREQTYEDLALADPDRLWELYRGQPREKPPMTWDHGDAITYLDRVLQPQLE